MDDLAERAYTAWPDRIYLIHQDGRIRFKTEPGPFGFSTSQLEVALNEIPEPRSRSSPKPAIMTFYAAGGEVSSSMARCSCSQRAADQQRSAQTAPAVQPANTSVGQWTPR